MKTLRQWAERLRKAYERRRQDHCSGGTAGVIDLGLETKRHGGPGYYWDGLRRGGEKERPRLLVQATLEGWGQYRAGAGRWQRVLPGQLFTAVLPSAHTYRLPETSPQWTFAWLILQHDSFVTRLLDRIRPLNRIWEATSAGTSAPLSIAMEEVFAGVASGHFLDPFRREEAIFRLVLALERSLSPRRSEHPWLGEIQNELAGRWANPPTVVGLARHFGLSRTAFSHAFRRQTGTTPAACLRDWRLIEAGRLLKDGRYSIKEVASATGFGDAAQFAKAFRQKYALAPSEYRAWFR